MQDINECIKGIKMIYRFFLSVIVVSLVLMLSTCDSLWVINNSTDISFSVGIEDLYRAIEKSNANARSISSESTTVTVTIREAKTQRKEAERVITIKEGEKDNLTISFNKLAVVGKTVFAEIYTETEGDVSIGRSETKKMVRGINVLHISELNSLSAVEMVTVPQGSFERDPDGKFDFSMTQTVTLSTFEMGETEVTQKQWLDVMGGWANDKKPTEALGAGEDFPTYYVSWYDAVNYCNKLTELEMGEEHQVYTINGVTVTQDISKKGYRLPTEAEWEYAAGGGFSSRTKYAGTDTDSNLGSYAWYGSSGGQTHKVKGKEKNLLNLYDMNGNVSEWCWDWHHEDGYYGGLQTNPEGYLSGSNKVLRGGSFVSNVDSLHVSWRTYNEPTKQDTATIGFRVVRTK